VFGDRMLVADAVLAGFTEHLAVDHICAGTARGDHDGEEDTRANEPTEERGEG
jgi:hypothetical protein